MSGLVPKARAKQQEGEAYKARCRHQDAARAFREAADLFSRAAEHMATDPVERATLRVYAENNSTQSELAEQRAIMQGDVREHYGAAVAAAVSSVVTPASLQLSSAGAADPTDVAELKQRIEELESSLRTTEEKLQQRTQQLESTREILTATTEQLQALRHAVTEQLLVPNWHGQPSSLSEAVKHATDENPALQTMLHQLMLAVRANSRSQAGAVQVTSTASAAAEALITASPAFVQHTQLSGQLAEVRQDLARGVAPAAVAVVPASAAAAPQPHVGASGAGLLQPVPTSPPRRPGSDPDETPVSSPVRQKSQAAPVTGSASVPPPQTRSSPPPNNHPAPAITSFVLAPSTATEEDSTTAQSPAAQTPSSPAASQPPAGPDPVPDVPAQSSSAALAPPAAAAAPAPVTSPVAASSPGLGASPLATSALPSMYVSTATSYYDNGDDDSDDGDIFSQPNIVPPSLRSSTYQS